MSIVSTLPSLVLTITALDNDLVVETKVVSTLPSLVLTC